VDVAGAAGPSLVDPHADGLAADTEIGLPARHAALVGTALDLIERTCLRIGHILDPVAHRAVQALGLLDALVVRAVLELLDDDRRTCRVLCDPLCWRVPFSRLTWLRRSRRSVWLTRTWQRGDLLGSTDDSEPSIRDGRRSAGRCHIRRQYQIRRHRRRVRRDHCGHRNTRKQCRGGDGAVVLRVGLHSLAGGARAELSGGRFISGAVGAGVSAGTANDLAEKLGGAAPAGSVGSLPLLLRAASLPSLPAAVRRPHS
jgi:hypothetical protein